VGHTKEYSDNGSHILLIFTEVNGPGFTLVEINPKCEYFTYTDDNPTESFVTWSGSTTLPDDECFLRFYFHQRSQDIWGLEVNFEVHEREYHQKFDNLMKTNGDVWTPSDFYETFQRELFQHYRGEAFLLN
jgi:hypothetical protein